MTQNFRDGGTGEAVPFKLSGCRNSTVEGKVTGIRAFINMEVNDEAYLFENQLIVEVPNLDHGDSGSLVLSDDNRIGRLFFALSYVYPLDSKEAESNLRIPALFHGYRVFVRVIEGAARFASELQPRKAWR
jgi:hypothetical protein